MSFGSGEVIVLGISLSSSSSVGLDVSAATHDFRNSKRAVLLVGGGALRQFGEIFIFFLF